jgi:hemerythrin-like domain-containing protein
MLGCMDDSIAALSVAHRNIEAQLGTLEELSRNPAPTAAAARAVVRYFDTEGREHHRDEDEDLFPLLRVLAAERGRADVAAVMEELEREHASMDRQWSRLREGLAGLAEGQGSVLDADEVMRFAWLYRRHMKYEAAVVIPFATEALTMEQRAGFASRMAERRGLPA